MFFIMMKMMTMMMMMMMIQAVHVIDIAGSLFPMKLKPVKEVVGGWVIGLVRCKAALIK